MATLKIRRQVSSLSEIEAGKTVVTTEEKVEEYEFGEGLQWEVRDLFLVFNDADGKRLAFHSDFVRAFDFVAPYTG